MRIRAEKRAFSIVEFLVAVAIVGAAIIPISYAFTMSWEANIDASRRSKAVMLGRWKLEKVRSLNSYEELDDVPRTDCELPEPHWEHDGGKYGCEITVRQIDSDHDRYEAKELAITMFLPSGGEAKKTLQCQSANCSQPDFITMVSKKDGS